MELEGKLLKVAQGFYVESIRRVSRWEGFEINVKCLHEGEIGPTALCGAES